MDTTFLYKCAVTYQQFLKVGDQIPSFVITCIQQSIRSAGYDIVFQFDNMFVGRSTDGEYFVLDINKRRFNMGIFRNLAEYFNSFNDLFRADELIN